MLHASELRIGNYVLGDGLECCVTAHDIYMMDSGKLISEPILITPEIIDKCGFAKQQLGFYKDPFFIYQPGSPKSNYGFGVKGLGLICSVKHLHHLQNLCFVLGREELQYTP